MKEEAGNGHNSDLMIFGLRPVMEAIEEGKDIERVFIQRDLRSPLIFQLKTLLKEAGIHPVTVPIEKLNRLTRKNHQGVVCYLSSITYFKLSDVVPGLFEQGVDPVLLLLDRITDVRNFGAICRTAECTGVHAVVVPEKGGAPANGDAVKSSAGALHRISVCREYNLKDAIDYLKDSGFRIVGCSEKGADYTYDFDFNGPVCIIMGSEENGISSEYLKKCDNILRIPMEGKTASLNVSVAAGMILYELIRQRSISEK